MIRCKSEVSTLANDPTGGTLLVGTASGTCEVWSIQCGDNETTKAKRTALIDIRDSIASAFKSSSDDDAMEDTDELESETTHDSDGSVRMRRTLLTILNSPKITSFHHPSHLPFSACGFVSLQHCPNNGSSLLLWRKDMDQSLNESFRIVSCINLPLAGGSAQAPRVHYDGRRILVFGQDHIGMIILVYHVLSSNEDIDLFLQDTRKEERTSEIQF